MHINILKRHWTALLVGAVLSWPSAAPVAARGRASTTPAHPRPDAVSTTGPRITPGAAAAWQRYAEETERRRAREVKAGAPFLLLDLGGNAADERRALMAGEVVVRPLELRDAAGEVMEVDAARVHHWRGAIFIPGATVDGVLNRLRQSPPPQEDVLRAQVLERGPDRMKVALRLRRTKILTVVYDTEHDVTFATHGPSRASSTTRATRIVEVANPGRADERTLAPGEDRGFLWRLNAYWRYEQVQGGVIAECESISLSRDVPFGLGTIVGPIINSTARDAMDAALKAVKEAS